MANVCWHSLSIRDRLRVVPYPPSRPDRAFRSLKGQPDQVALHCDDDPALHDLVTAINAPGTRLFTIASALLVTDLERGCRRSGYIEFAINSRREVGFATSYFPVLSSIQCRQAHGLDRVQFGWEFGETQFLDAGVSGVACSIYVKTAFVDSPAVADHDWRRALSHLGQHLGAFRGVEDDPIYRPPHAASSPPGRAPSVGLSMACGENIASGSGSALHGPPMAADPLSPIEYTLRTGDVAGGWQRFSQELRRDIRAGRQPFAKSLGALCYENLATLLRVRRHEHEHKGRLP